MRSGRTMLWTNWCLLAFLAFSSLTSLAFGSPLKMMLAPNLLRVGTTENIFVECQDCSGGEMRVAISVLTYPTQNKQLSGASVTLTSANNFQGFGQIKIPPEDFSRNANIKQKYVLLQAKFPDHTLDKVVLVSIQSDYIFIQTDKTLYTPNSRVLYRIFAVTPGMEPVERHYTTDASIDIEIVTPEGNILPQNRFNLHSGISSEYYQLDKFCSLGLWKVVAKFHSNPQESFSAEFEVKEYVLPSFKVELTTPRSYLYIDNLHLTINIKPTYLFGEEVKGTAYALFGIVHEGRKLSFPSSLQRVPIQNGYGIAELKREHFTQTFKNTNILVGSSVFVAVTVLTEDGGEMTEAELTGMPIITSPYIIRFKNTPKFFKPGMSFDIEVEVVNPDETPAQDVQVVVNPDAVQCLTMANGRARCVINTPSSSSTLTITAKTNVPWIPPGRQATTTMEAVAQIAKEHNYILISVSKKKIQLGANLGITLYFSRPLPNTDITYLILSRGQLVKHNRYKLRGERVISFEILVTNKMMPSFRIIAYYHRHDNAMVSDSVLVDVEDSCTGSLKLEQPKTLSNDSEKVFSLKITGNPKGIVGLVAVDKGITSMSNVHLLTQKKVWDIIEKSDTGCTPGGGLTDLNVFSDAGLLFECSAFFGTLDRTDWRCPSPTRRKRATTKRDVTTNSHEIVTVPRTQLPESWLWSVIKLPACPSHTPNCASTSIQKILFLPHSITTWQLFSISLSKTQGICVSNPLEVERKKTFFIDLKLPLSAVKGEQLEIKAIIHNHISESAIVDVDFLPEPNVCNAAFKLGKFHQEVTVGAHTTLSVPFVILPTWERIIYIHVKAAVRNSSLQDQVRKELHVRSEGVLTKYVETVTLDPTNKGLDGVQLEEINSEIPDQPQSRIIFLKGSAPSLFIGEESVRDLILEPSGDGESNMVKMTLPVVAAMYLDKTNQWQTMDFEKRHEAINYIMNGYRNELNFCKSDGSFAVSAESPSSTWLTAYVVKVFAMANHLVPLQRNVICQAVKFLILNALQPDGMFIEVGRVIDGKMIGGVHGTDSDASMTAFCLIALQETHTLCASVVDGVSSSISKAVTYLEKRLPRLTNPYAVAMTSYALANENKLNLQILFTFVSSDSSHWPVSGNSLFTLEATAYALLALIKAKAFEEARPVMTWLAQQRRVSGDYGSTQATIMVYQAMAESWDKGTHLNVNIIRPGRLNPYLYTMNSNNYNILKTFKLNNINRNINVEAVGVGVATLTMVSMYYALPGNNAGVCQKFNLNVQALPVKVHQAEKIYRLEIMVLYKDREHDAVMSVLDIGLPAGFIANTDDLNLLSRRLDPTISKYDDMNTVLLKNSSVIIYLDKVSHTQPEEITFRIHQKLEVGVVQPVAVSVYEYYDKNPCVKFYHPERSAQLQLQCIGDMCLCAEDMCSEQKKGTVTNDDRIKKSCEITQTTETDYVYKAQLIQFENQLSSDIYTMSIQQVIKEGRIDIPLQGAHRSFFSIPKCRSSLNLQIGKTYLIMGISHDIYLHQKTFSYIFNEKTWIEYWPTEEECQTEEYRLICLGLIEMVNRLFLFGCLVK